MKREHFGGEHVALHASRDRLTGAQEEAIANFFRASQLRRFSYICEAPPLTLPGVDALNAMRGFLMEEVVDHVCQLPKLPEDLAIVFETSQRLSPKIIETFPGLAFTLDESGHEEDGVERQVVTAFVDKAVGLPTLEMADQVAYYVQREVRRGLPIVDPATTFQAIFPDPRPPRARLILMRVASAKYESNGVTYTFPEPGKVGFRFEGLEGLAAANRWLAQMPFDEAARVLGLQNRRSDVP